MITMGERGPEMPGERVEADLRRRIGAGEWERGQRLPTVAQLSAHYRVGRGTVARALARMAEDGLVIIRDRWGTFRA